MKKGPLMAPISPRRTSRIQTSESRQVGSAAAAAPAAARLFEAPEWITQLVAIDRRYSKWVHETFLTDRTYMLLRFFEFSGDGLFWLPGTAAFWLSPSAGRADTRMFALNLFISLLADLFVVGCIKSAVQRKRPRYNREHLAVVAMDQWSFPSGHSTRAVMIVTLIWMYTPMWRALIKQHWWPYLVLKYENSFFVTEYVLPYVENRVLSIANHVFLLWLLATTASRVVLGRHYILDVFGGIVVGMLEALGVHLCLHVPLHVSEMQHDYILSRFGWYEEVFWRFFHGRFFFTNYHREMNEEEHELVHRPVP